MNLVDCCVTEIIGEPYEAYGKWWQKVRYESWGAPSTSELMFSTKAEAKSVVIGHHFLA